MRRQSASDDCPATPDSVDASSLHDASSNIDDLTLALMNFSQVPSLESQQAICCCCGSAECKATRNWLDLKEKLEKRLHLSAEVGSALLQRHEAYVRQHESDEHTSCHASEAQLESDVHGEVGSRVAELIKDNAILEKRLTQALLNVELAEASHKTVLQDLEEARVSVTRLTAHQARTVGIDSRLTIALQENDDLRQERDSETQRAKSAEARIVTLKHRSDKLQAEVRRLQADLELRRLQRLESSESLLQDVRSRLKGLHRSHSSLVVPDDSEIMEVLESLVSDNEILKADNEELHTLLTESREDLQAIQSQMEEHIVSAPPIRVDTPSRHSRTGSGPSSFIRDSLLNSAKRPSSTEPRTHTFEPLTPETSQRPLSPAESMVPSETKYTSISYQQPQYPPSHFSSDVDEHGLDHFNAIQTDHWPGSQPIAHLARSVNEHASSHDGRSDSSSMFDGQPTPLSALLERVMSLLSRMSQADALTLTNRLKRQHLRGSYVKHLSRTTVSNIISEIAQLRAQYRLLLEDEKASVLCTRRDLRGLFKLFKDVFEELGQLRVTLNDVIVEPSIAQKLSEMALDPAKAEAMQSKASGPDSGWMAPFSKLFGSSTEADTHPSPRTHPRSVSRGREIIREPRPVPKLAPALAASTTTVNVEFSGASVGKPVTSTFSAHPTNDSGSPFRVNTIPRVPTSTGSNTRNVMGIFAGAPHPDDVADQWVVLPRTPRRIRSTTFKPVDPSQNGTAITRPPLRKQGNSQLSREVDAVIDREANLDHDEAIDTPGPLPERTLRRRGLSDSSIHSTYINQTEHGASAESSNRGSVLQTLSRTVRNFSIAASQTVSGSLTSPPSNGRVPEGTVTSPQESLEAPKPRRAASPMLSSLIPNLALTSWAAAGAALENSRSGSRAMYYGSVRDDSIMPRPWGCEDQRDA